MKKKDVAISFAAVLFLASPMIAPALASSNINVNQTMWNVGPNPGQAGGPLYCPQDPTAGGTDTLTPLLNSLAAPAKNGQATVHYNGNANTFTVDISFSGGPASTTMQVDVRCNSPALGFIQTDANGNGFFEYTTTGIPSWASSGNFAFDAAAASGSGYANYGQTFISTVFSPI